MPNKKYTEEMFQFTEAELFEGKKEYVAFENTLKEFGFDRELSDSYRKRFKVYLKRK